MRYLLDTTLIVDHAHGYEPAMELLHRLYEDGAELFTCDVVVCEALSGQARLGRHRSGGKLGLGDALIAAVAADMGATVVTCNRPDFERHGASVLTYP